MSAAPPSLSGGTVLSLLTALPIPSPAAQELTAVHAPFAAASALPTGALNKWLARLNAAVTAREPAACALAEAVVDQDVEGVVVALHGKSWMAACLGSLGGSTLPLDAVPAFLALTRALVAAGPHAPAYEREVVNPAMGKLAVTMGRLVERVLEGDNWSVMNTVLEATRELLIASPAPFRPATSALRPTLRALALRLPPHEAVPEPISIAAAETMALFYLCGGKAAAPAAWGTEMKEVLGGLSASITALCAEAWDEEPPRTQPLPPPASLPTFPADPTARVLAALAAIEGYTECALALLRQATARPVPVPLAQLVSTALRLLNLTLATPTAPHVSPAHHAVLIGAFPRLWRSGVLLLASASMSTGDHLVPHLTAILEHSVFLLESLPVGMTDARRMLVEFHDLLLDEYPAAILPVEYVARLLRFALGPLGLGTLLDARAAPAATPTPGATGGGRKSKKRARGAEDALIGALEGRAARATTQAEAEVYLTLLSLTPKLHTAPLLPPALLTFSLRLHLSSHMTLRTRPGLTAHAQLAAAVDDALEAAAHLSASGSARDVRTLLVALLPATSRRNAALDELLHPSLPPMARPMPPLAQLHMFAPESDEERKVRRGLGYVVPGEGREAESDDDGEDEEMAVDGVFSAPAPAPAPVSVPVPVVSIAPVPLPMPMPTALPVAPLTTATTPASPVPPVSLPAASAPGIPPAAAVPAPDPIAALDPAVPFMSVPTAATPTSATAPAPVQPAPAPAGDESDDEAIPELDSGSSDEDEDEE